MEKLSLVGKLAELLAVVERVPKSGYNDFHKYHYATEADIVSAVRVGMSERGLILVPDVQEMTWREAGVTRDGKAKDPICTLKVKFTVYDGSETLSFIAYGEGQDGGDKAVYKAMTGATKYALLKLFLIPTGDDPEHAAGDHSRNTGQESPRLRGRDYRPAPKVTAPVEEIGRPERPQTAPEDHQAESEALFANPEGSEREFLEKAVERKANEHKLTQPERKSLADSYLKGKGSKAAATDDLNKLYGFLMDPVAVADWRKERSRG